MAMPEWISVQPQSGTGGAKVKVSCSPFRGREDRVCVMTARTSHGVESSCEVRQLGVDGFVSVDATEYPVAAGGGPVAIGGLSNAPCLQVVKNSGDLSIDINSIKAGGHLVENGANIPGDPGAEGEYRFEVAIEVPENLSRADRQAEIQVSFAM